MMMLSCLKLLENNYIFTAPGDQILLVYDDDQSFYTPRINNHSFTAPSAHISGVMTMHSTLKLPKTNHSITAPSAHIFLGSDSLQC